MSKTIKGVLGLFLLLCIVVGCSNESSDEVSELKAQVADLQKQVKTKEQEAVSEVEENVVKGETTTENPLNALVGTWVFTNAGENTGQYFEIIKENNGLISVNWMNDPNWYGYGEGYAEYSVIDFGEGFWELETVTFGGFPFEPGDPEVNEQETFQIINNKLHGVPTLFGKVENSAVKIDTSLKNLGEFKDLVGEWYVEGEEYAYNVILEDDEVILEGLDEDMYSELYMKVIGTTEDNRLYLIAEKQQTEIAGTLKSRINTPGIGVFIELADQSNFSISVSNESEVPDIIAFNR